MSLVSGNSRARPKSRRACCVALRSFQSALTGCPSLTRAFRAARVKCAPSTCGSLRSKPAIGSGARWEDEASPVAAGSAGGGGIGAAPGAVTPRAAFAD